jgi:hypothetical protein
MPTFAFKQAILKLEQSLSCPANPGCRSKQEQGSAKGEGSNEKEMQVVRAEKCCG